MKQDFETFLSNIAANAHKEKGKRTRLSKTKAKTKDRRQSSTVVLDLQNPSLWERRPSMKTHAVLLMGESRVGKSSIIARYCYNIFPYFYDPGWDRDFKEVTISNETHKIELEDLSTYVTPDQPYDLRDRVIATAEGFVLVYDITSKASFDSIRAIYGEVRRKGGVKRPVVILGNKNDDTDAREVPSEIGTRLAKQLRCRFAEVSAKNGTGLEELFLELATDIEGMKQREARAISNVNCRNVGRALIEVLVKLNKGLERLHWKILYWMYGPDKPLRVRPMVRPVSEAREVVRVRSTESARSERGRGTGAVSGGKTRERKTRRTGQRSLGNEQEVMSGGLEISMAGPSGVALQVHRI